MCKQACSLIRRPTFTGYPISSTGPSTARNCNLSFLSTISDESHPPTCSLTIPKLPQINPPTYAQVTRSLEPMLRVYTNFPLTSTKLLILAQIPQNRFSLGFIVNVNRSTPQPSKIVVFFSAVAAHSLTPTSQQQPDFRDSNTIAQRLGQGVIGQGELCASPKVSLFIQNVH